MPFLYKFSLGKEKGRASILGSSEVAAVKYHDIFDYPLNFSELIKWTVGKKGGRLNLENLPEIEEKNGYYFLKGKKDSIYKRSLKERISERKLKIAQGAAAILRRIPTIKLIAATGALAMKNVNEEADIDLLIVTQKGRLWLARIFSYLALRITNYAVRKPNDRNGKDKLCLNIWLDERTLVWPENDRNIYTAHEIAQIVPLVNKDRTYERFLSENSWIMDYWPSAVKLPQDTELRIMNYANPLYIILNSLFSMVNRLAFKLQYLYMKPKITREVVTLHKAIFHPRNWGKEINELLSA